MPDGPGQKWQIPVPTVVMQEIQVCDADLWEPVECHSTYDGASEDLDTPSWLNDTGVPQCLRDQ